ncbi:MAG: hypothetical protein DRP64_10250 [Verrucomicrobia bacterium]|nr:MAG: hypothetical protein DRP64_10250 [Verrucomicrobiota bacterium]
MLPYNKILLIALLLELLGIYAVATDMRAELAEGKTLAEIEREFADSSQRLESIKTYSTITTTYGGVFRNVDILRVDVDSIYCRSQIGNCDIPLAHLPSEVLADLDSFIAQAKEQAAQKVKEEQRKRLEAERERIQAEQKRKEAERLRIQNEEQSQKRLREEQQTIQRENAERLFHDEERKKANAPSDDSHKSEPARIDPFVKRILIVVIVGSIIAGLLRRKKLHIRE